MQIQKKWIEGYEGLYWITSEGKVISAERFDRYNRHVGGELKAHYAGSGYLFVALYKNGKGTQRYIHRLVAKAFIPNPENKPCVDHVDNDRGNNSVSNLRWVTYKENMNNQTTRAKMLEDTSRFGVRGAKNPFSRKVRCYSLDGEYLKTFDCMQEAARFAGITDASISKVCQGERFQAGGYFWAYDGTAKCQIARVPRIPTNRRAIQQFSTDGKLIAEYPSVKDAAEALGIFACNIVHNAKGEGKSYKGYIWRYK